jgi:hypothetical protein
MNPTRISKIARLPKSIRDQLGERIEDGQIGTHILQWLNAQPEVIKILQEHFDGRPINDPNLSDWKLRGHMDWLRLRDAKHLADRLVERSNIFAETTQGQPVSDRFASVLALEFTRLAENLLEVETDPDKRWNRLCQIHREFSRFRRDDHRATCTNIKGERWGRRKVLNEREDRRLAHEQRKKEMLDPVQAMADLDPLRAALGKDDWALAAAAYMAEVKHDLPIGYLEVKSPIEKPLPPKLVSPEPTSGPQSPS